MKTTRNFMYFLYNFPYGWENEFLKNDPMKDHLLGKLEMYKERNTSGNSAVVIMEFFFSLGTDRQEKLIQWVEDNYQGVSN